MLNLIMRERDHSRDNRIVHLDPQGPPGATGATGPIKSSYTRMEYVKKVKQAPTGLQALT